MAKERSGILAQLLLEVVRYLMDVELGEHTRSSASRNPKRNPILPNLVISMVKEYLADDRRAFQEILIHSEIRSSEEKLWKLMPPKSVKF